MKKILLLIFLLSFGYVNTTFAEQSCRLKFFSNPQKARLCEYCKSNCTLNSMMCSMMADYEAQKACEIKAEIKRRQCIAQCET